MIVKNASLQHKKKFFFSVIIQWNKHSAKVNGIFRHYHKKHILINRKSDVFNLLNRIFYLCHAGFFRHHSTNVKKLTFDASDNILKCNNKALNLTKEKSIYQNDYNGWSECLFIFFHLSKLLAWLWDFPF